MTTPSAVPGPRRPGFAVGERTWTPNPACGCWTTQALDRLFDAFALMADLKSGYLAGHSQGVAGLARSPPSLGPARDRRAAAVGHAALLHDLGRVSPCPAASGTSPPRWASPNGSVCTCTATTPTACCAAAPRCAPMPTSPVVRTNGRMVRATTAATRAPSGRRGWLAAADVYRACLEDRAHRPALSRDGGTPRCCTTWPQGRLCARRGRRGAGGGRPARRRRAERRRLERARTSRCCALLVRGLSNKQIARELAISPRTVQHHTIHIYGKTGVQSRAGAALWAVEQGLYCRPRLDAPQ